jgi:phosphomevalonate kinase
MTKELAIAKREMEDAENKRFIEQQKRKKQEEEKAKREMIEQLERDKADRFGKEYKANVENKKKTSALDDCKYYVEAIVKLYPVFRCGDQAKNCLNTIKVVLSNIIKSPEEEKFQKIKMTNPNVAERIGKIPLAIKLLIALGFKEDNEFYIYSVKDFELLKSVVVDIDSQISKIK